jgi:DNA-binding NarL/FixJ family response regulator
MLVDISMPGKNGIQMIRELRDALPETRFIIISMHSEADYIVEAFRAGATGYMIKESAAANLIQGLNTVAKGELFLDGALSQEVIFKLLQSKSDITPHRDPYSSLTSREQEVMRMLAEGMTTKEVAAKLFISPKTVENHRTNLMKKLGLQSTVELIRYSARLGLIDLDTWAI